MKTCPEVLRLVESEMFLTGKKVKTKECLRMKDGG